MPEVNSLEMLLHEELRDLYDAEKRLTKAIPKMVKKATDENLRDALEAHLGETENQVDRLERAFEMLGKPARGKACAGIQGIIEEASEHMSEDYSTDELLDVVIVASAQRAEHYEIAAYGNAIAHAKQLGRNNVVELLEETLEEEKAADEKLTQVGEPLNAAAQSSGDESMSGEENDDADDEEDDEDSAPAAKRNGGMRAAGGSSNGSGKRATNGRGARAQARR